MTAKNGEGNTADATDIMDASLEHYRVFRAALLKFDNGMASASDIESCIAFFDQNEVSSIEDVLAFTAIARTFYLRAMECLARGNFSADSLYIANVAEQAMEKTMAYLATATGKRLPQSSDIQRALN